ncbi:MAG: DUF29 domain-containing protein [Nitrospirae bacterium]|uniref:DUF29 domain-containing protein n=1 Tax=Candidatus Magnetobacterium casense TaxID=1455061 RepID=UPI0006980CFA|nr:DUF29 domain-containing protein [Candidatus Magnetobacterium casensis]MBF0338691.1 DUF29 domain-containing protein [Nitrospirota bacterium]
METQTLEPDFDASKDEFLYASDFYKWSLKTAELLRQGRFGELDIESIAEEIESLGKSEKKELRNRLAVLIMHLLKWQYQPDKRSESWKSTISIQRVEIKFVLKDSPSLKHIVETIINEAYEKAIVMFQKETRFSQTELPETCPYTFNQLIDNNFLPL